MLFPKNHELSGQTIFLDLGSEKFLSFVTVEQAIELLNRSQVVGVPTETVYGLAGLIDSPEAIAAIFSTKQRPSFDPLIVHVSGKEQAQIYTVDWNEVHSVLTEKFWPGPLTVVLKKSELVSDAITAGLPTVGLRMPLHPVALEILKQVRVPFAAPSANMFSKTSPTRAEHVESEFKGTVPVVDGGPCQVGLESTICTVTEFNSVDRTCRVHILRRGHITATDLQQALQSHGWSATVEVKNSTVAPGQLDVHYQPQIPLVTIKSADLSEVEILNLCNKNYDTSHVVWLNLNEKPEMAARHLYAQLRDLSKPPATLLLCRWNHDWTLDAWLTIWDRLQKASREIF